MEIKGSVRISPPLNAAETAYLTRFNATRRMARTQGPYFVDGAGLGEQTKGPDIIDYSSPPAGQPSMWCGWEPSEDGTELVWDRMETFHAPVEWMTYLIEHFLRPGAHASTYDGPYRPEAFRHFTFDHTVEGRFHVVGPDRRRWDLIVTGDTVETVDLAGHGVPGMSSESRWAIQFRASPSREQLMAEAREYLNSPRSGTVPWHVQAAVRDRATALGVPLDSQSIADELLRDPETDTDGLLDLLTLIHDAEDANTLWSMAMRAVEQDQGMDAAQQGLAAALNRILGEVTTVQDKLLALGEGHLFHADYAEGAHGENLEALMAEISLRVRCAIALDRQVNPHHTPTDAVAVVG